MSEPLKKKTNAGLVRWTSPWVR